MTAIAYRVVLTPAERTQLQRVLHQSTATVFSHRRARILLAADHQPDRPAATDEAIAGAVGVSVRTVARTRVRWAEAGVTATLQPRDRGTKGRTRFATATQARIAQVACSDPPPGHARWTVRLLADRVVELAIVPAIAPETVRQVLKKTISNRG
jgi:transposase